MPHDVFEAIRMHLEREQRGTRNRNKDSKPAIGHPIPSTTNKKRHAILLLTQKTVTIKALTTLPEGFPLTPKPIKPKPNKNQLKIIKQTLLNISFILSFEQC